MLCIIRRAWSAGSDSLCDQELACVKCEVSLSEGELVTLCLLYMPLSDKLLLRLKHTSCRY
jgi:hypothetical protein